MRVFLVVICSLFLVACEVSPVKDTQSIKIQTKLSPEITEPVPLKIAYYANQEELTRVYQGAQGYVKWRFNTGIKFRDALELVMPEVFESAKPLKLGLEFDYLIKFTSEPSYSNTFGKYSVSLNAEVLNRAGEVVFKTESKPSITTGGVYSDGVYFNVYAKGLKEVSYQFLNHLGIRKIAAVAALVSDGRDQQAVSISDLLGDLKPSSSGTGFYINSSGQIVTAQHVVRDCLMLEVQSKGDRQVAFVSAESKILDLAVLDTDLDTASTASLPAVERSSILGLPVFTTGFPLAGILSENPSLTIGNISSAGGLKGAKGQFQFTAPIQPGNSGGAIVDYSGNLVGVVTSSLNQRMMLSNTGTVSQNVNFGLDVKMLKKFLNKENVLYVTKNTPKDFEAASVSAIEYTNQVLCYK